MNKILSAFEAVSLIKSYDVIAINGLGSIGHAEEFEIALAELYEKNNSPCHLTLIHAVGQGTSQTNMQIDRLAKEGLIQKVICGHFGSAIKITDSIIKNRIEC